MTAPPNGYAPHPHIGGRATVLRALAAWRMEWPGAPRVVVLTGNPGSGRSHLLTGFLMLCDPEFRRRLPLADLDPSTVPPELPAPAVPSAAGLTAAQFGWLLAGHYGLQATRIEDVYAELAALDRPVTVVVPDVDQAGPDGRPENRPGSYRKYSSRSPPRPTPGFWPAPQPAPRRLHRLVALGGARSSTACCL